MMLFVMQVRYEGHRFTNSFNLPTAEHLLLPTTSVGVSYEWLPGDITDVLQIGLTRRIFENWRTIRGKREHRCLCNYIDD